MINMPSHRYLWLSLSPVQVCQEISGSTVAFALEGLSQLDYCENLG